MTLCIKNLVPRLAALAGITSALAFTSTAMGQAGVAPSQTGLFFDDLRSRAAQFNKGSAVNEGAYPTSSSGTYDYSRGEYSGESIEERALGERPSGLDDVGRELGYTGSRSGGSGYSKRAAGDYTGSLGQYPTSGSYFAPTYITDPFLSGKRNMKLGPVNIGLGMNANLEYNDNVNLSKDDKLDDFIAGLYFNVDANYRITQNNQLGLTLAFGFDHYFNESNQTASGSDFNLNVLPGSTLSFDVKVGDILFVFYDRLSVRPQSQDEFALDDFDVFGSVQNDAGVGASWAINSKLNLSLNVNRSDSWALEDEYSILDRVVHSFSGSLGWSPTNTFIIGVEGSYSIIDYEEDFNNDGTTLSGGVFLILPITKNTIMKASVGVQEFDFDSPAAFSRKITENDIINTQAQIAQVNAQITDLSETAVLAADPELIQQQADALEAMRLQLQDQLAAQTIQKQADDDEENSKTFDNEDLSDYYYNVTLFNQISSRVSHQLAFGHESALNTSSNFVTADYVSYGVGIIAWRGSRLSLGGYYEEAEESGGRFAENTNQFGLDAFLSHRLTNQVTLGFGYHYGDTDSNLEGRDYLQHSFTFDVNYAVNSKLNVGLGYRHFTTDAEDPTLSFDQNRVIMTMNYNF